MGSVRVTRIDDLEIGWRFHLELGDGYTAETYVSRGLLDPLRPGTSVTGPLVDVGGVAGRVRSSVVWGPAGVTCDVEYGPKWLAMVGEAVLRDDRLRAAVARLLVLGSAYGRPLGSRSIDRDDLLSTGVEVLGPGTRRSLQPIADALGVDYQTVQRAVKAWWGGPAPYYAAVDRMRSSPSPRY